MQSLDRYREPQDPHDAFRRRLDEALATKPVVAVLPDFAERVAAMVPVRPAVRVFATSYARRTVVISTVLLLAALLLLAPHVSSGTTIPVALEWTVCALLSMIALLTISPWSPWHLRG